MRIFFIIAAFTLVTQVSCQSAARVQEAPSRQSGSRPVNTNSAAAGNKGIADEIRRLTESGDRASMKQALDLINSRDLGRSEFGRVMTAVNLVLTRRMYPEESVGTPPPDFPQAHLYARIIRGAEQGVYTPPQPASTDYFEHILPFLAVFEETRRERLLTALPDLLKAQSLQPDSLIAPYFMGLVYERTGQPEAAHSAYTRVLDISEDCYPAVLGLVRVLQASGKEREALELLIDSTGRYPDNTAIKRKLAEAWYHTGDWAQAEPLIADILRQEGRNNGKFMLMRAHMLIESGQHTQAQALLDQYASLNPDTRLYLFLKARIQAETLRNRKQALTFLRTLLRSFPGDEEAMLYTARLLLESALNEERAEGRELLRQLLKQNSAFLPALSLSLQDAVNRESWQEARQFLQELFTLRRSGKDLYNAYLVERGLGNTSRALAYARELYDQDKTNDEWTAVYISALIDSGGKEEASILIERRLAVLSGGPAKSRYFFLRSRMGANEEAVLGYLRSSLFEDPRNLHALIAMFTIYHGRKDERRAVHYLKQAIAIAPGNVSLKRYAEEYAALMGNG